MSKSLLGSHVDGHTLSLLEEIRQLRERVAQLEGALEDAERVAERHAGRDEADSTVVLESTNA